MFGNRFCFVTSWKRPDRACPGGSLNRLRLLFAQEVEALALDNIRSRHQEMQVKP
jgi:hypothetical protein